MGVKIITAPIAEPVTLQQCRDHLRVTPFEEGSSDEAHPDDTIIMAMAAAAREWAENFTGLSLAAKTYELALDAFPDDEIEIPHPPLIEVVQITYVDEDEVVQTVPGDQYVIDNHLLPGWVFPARGFYWPAADQVVNSVRVTYRAGYAVEGDASGPEPLPAVAQAAILLVLGHLYEHREDATERALVTVPNGAKSLLRPLRLRFGMA